MKRLPLPKNNLGKIPFVWAMLTVIFLSCSSCKPSVDTANNLVVYCAHDSIFSESVLEQFTDQTGIKVQIRFDTEATKSLGLVQSIIAEKKHPRCDVFWNNEVLGTLDLQEQGLLQAYQSPNADRIPAKYKSPNGDWTGFGARLRLFIINTEKMQPTPEAVAKAMQDNLSQMAIAKPLYGTTLTHYSLLWAQMGGENLKKWHHQNIEAGWKIVPGNSAVKNLVANGVCHFGWTDTDDYFLAVDEKKPVAMLPVRNDQGETICIPNTVAIIKGTKRLSSAQRLVDFLLSEDVELGLAQSRSRQVPLGTVNEDELPAEVLQLKKWAAEGCDLGQLGEARNECLSWLREEFLQ